MGIDLDRRPSGRIQPFAPQGEDAWDRFVETVPGGDLVQTAMWGRAKCATSLEATLALHRRNGTILGGGLIVMKRFRPFGAVGYVARGPLVVDGSADALARVLDEVERTARAERVRHLVVQPPLGGEPVAAMLATRGYAPDAPEVAPSATLVLDLTVPLAAIMARMLPTRRGSVRQALQRGVEVRSGGREDLGTFATLHASTARRQGFSPLSKAYFEGQWDALRARGAVELFLACHEGRALAGIWITAFGDTVTYRIQGWSGEEPRLQPNVACHWRAIQWAKAKGYCYYDMGGIDRQHVEAIRRGESLGAGVARGDGPTAFKVGFGSKLVLLPRAWQLTFNPIARPVVRTAYARLAASPTLRRIIHNLRNG